MKKPFPERGEDFSPLNFLAFAESFDSQPSATLRHSAPKFPEFIEGAPGLAGGPTSGGVAGSHMKGARDGLVWNNRIIATVGRLS
jgi:hypothetical protein